MVATKDESFLLQKVNPQFTAGSPSVVAYVYSKRFRRLMETCYGDKEPYVTSLKKSPIVRISIADSSSNGIGPSHRILAFRRLQAGSVPSSQLEIDGRTYGFALATMKQLQGGDTIRNVVRVTVHPITPNRFYHVHTQLYRLYAIWHMFHYHPDDAARISFKLGMIGIVLALLAFVFDWKDIKETILCLLGS